MTVVTGVIMLFFSTFVFPSPSLATVKYRILGDQEWGGMDVSAPCIDRTAQLYNRVEDIFCQNIPAFQPQYKNPCVYEYQHNMQPVLQCLPYFYIIGMDKCGTTDLHSRIAAHPDVRGNKGLLGKETTFWSWSRYGVFNYQTTRRKSYLFNYYRMFSNVSREIQHRNESSNIITGDATPMDLWDFRSWHLIPQNFNKSQPEILTPHLIRYLYKERSPKILIQLRDPIERLYSDYIFLGQGSSPHTFHAHVLKAISIIKNCLKTKSLRLCFFDRSVYSSLPTRIHLGCYSVYIREWLAVFPRSTFHFTRTEDFHDNMEGTLVDIFSFLDLDPLPEDRLKTIVSQNRKHVTMSKRGEVLPTTFSILYDFYLPCLKQTASLLNDNRYLWEDVYKHKKNDIIKSNKNLLIHKYKIGTPRYIPKFSKNISVTKISR